VNREQLEHIIRAAADITNVKDLLIVGSQSVLGTWDADRLPPEAIRSMEADVVAADGDVGRTEKIEGAIGEGSQFHERFGVYAQGVGLETSVLPEGWRERLVALENPNTQPGRGLCLEPHDLVLAKMVAGRQRDYQFADALLKAGLLDPNQLASRVKNLPTSAEVRDAIRQWLRGQTKRGRKRAPTRV